MTQEKEKKYRRIGWIAAITTQMVMLLIFYFLIAWKAPDPPIPSYGIELSFGFENSGSGDIPLSSPVERQNVEEETSDEAEEVTDESSESSEPAEEAIEQIPVNNTPSPDVVKEVKPTVKSDPVKPKEEPVEKPSKTEEKKAEKPALNPAATMPKSDGQSNDSRGDDDTKGAKGKEDGSIDGRSLMGEQGSGGGASLQMSGWAWDAKPQPKDDSSESGKIVYKIKVDDEGYLVGIELVSSTVSPVVERYYRQSVERLSFTKTNQYSPAAISTGTITFIIRSK